ncbi:MAG TPA: ribosome biogenesis/translation initiation ATPase RLI [Nitrososphaerales archaeon]|nr:ribosome biogenesis/translation initiation ATPase RLI [Nitrososphaerales archaeon]
MSHRVAVLDKDSCHSRKCNLECITFCPVNKTGSDCIILGQDTKAVISEELCTGCGICVKKCPFEAITILNLATELGEEKVHQYGINTYRLYRLPIPKKNSVVGLVGKNGVGKSTALNVLSGSLRPNMGNYENAPSWDEIIDEFQGTELRSHFEAISQGKMRVSIKPQAVYLIPKVWMGSVRALLEKTAGSSREVSEIAESLSLKESLDRNVSALSGGELQRTAVAVAALKDADLYLFDEPSSYNDVFQRMNVSKTIAELSKKAAVILVEHDLSFLDYLSDYIHILYGEPGVYGIVSSIQSARTGINELLEGYLQVENVRFRDQPVRFDIYSPIENETETPVICSYDKLTKNYENFSLNVEPAEIKMGQVVGILGANALGKTTFFKVLAGVEPPTTGHVNALSKVAYKPQYLSAESDSDVITYFRSINKNVDSGLFQTQLITPLSLHKLFEKQLKNLSGGELQKVAIVGTLLQDAQIFAFDEPSAFIDVEDRIVLAKAIQRFVRSMGKTALVIDHDIQLVDIVADSLMIFSGEPGRKGYASKPLPKNEGMNTFLKQLGITYRRDINTGRPRVNKPESKLDRMQKDEQKYYYVGKPQAVAENEKSK